MNVADIVQHHAAWHPDRLAVICGSKRVTYGQLANRILRLASALAARGIGRGTHVGVLSTNSAAYVEIVYALAELGATWVPINFRLAPPEIAYILEDSGAKFLFYSANFEEVVAGLRDTFGPALTALPLGDSPDGGYEALIKSARPASRPRPR